MVSVWLAGAAGRIGPAQRRPVGGRPPDRPRGGLAKDQRPFRVHVDPIHDGAEEVFDLGDRIRTELYQRIGFADLLEPADGSLT